MIDWTQFVVGNLIVASFIGVLAWQVGRVGRRAKLAHLLWVAFFIKLITPPIVSLPVLVPANWVSESKVSATAAVLHRGPQSRSVAASHAESNQEVIAEIQTVGWFGFALEWLVQRVDWWKCLGLLWLIGGVAILLRGLLRFIRFDRLLSSVGRHDDEATAFVDRLLRQSGTRRVTSSRGPSVIRVPIRVSPMLFGFGLRSTIVCPDQLWQTLSSEDRHAFLAHETAHYCRCDHWVRWLEWITTAAYWWFPAVYLARHQLQRHEEACCDAWAVQQLGAPPRQYAEALLRVVDFVSDHRAGIPRVASGMGPTDSLAERLRLVMQGRGVENSSSTMRLGAGLACVSLWLVHPIPIPTGSIVADQDVPRLAATAPRLPGNTPRVPVLASAPAVVRPLPNEIQLPKTPSGFWNRRPPAEWASFSLRLPGTRLIAESKRGISIEVRGNEPLRFSSNELSAIVEIPSTKRVVIGDRSGQLRLWDLAAGTPVSLIGRHAEGVTSAAYHETNGLVSGDGGGSVMRWDLQSGQVLATWSPANAPVQSVRCSQDGAVLAILTGSWSQVEATQEVHFVDSRSLESLRSSSVPPGTAVIAQLPEHGWVAFDWDGTVSSVETAQAITTVDKRHVSALVFSPSAAHLVNVQPANSN